MTLESAYRWITVAYPPAFKATFADSMAADFTDALRDIRRTGRKTDLTILLALVGWDLVRSVTVQWARTSVPWLTMAYATALICFCEALATALVGGSFKWSVVVMMLPLVSAITFTLWFLVPHIRKSRSRPPCLKSAA